MKSSTLVKTLQQICCFEKPQLFGNFVTRLF